MHAKTYLIMPWIQPPNFRRRSIICASDWYGAPKTVKFFFTDVHALKSLMICAFGRIASRCNFLKRFKSSGSWSNVHSACVVKARRNTKQGMAMRSWLCTYLLVLCWQLFPIILSAFAVSGYEFRSCKFCTDQSYHRPRKSCRLVVVFGRHQNRESCTSRLNIWKPKCVGPGLMQNTCVSKQSNKCRHKMLLTISLVGTGGFWPRRSAISTTLDME